MSDLTAQFESSAKEAAAVVERCGRAPGGVRQAVERITKDATRIVSGVPEFVEMGIAAALSEIPGVIRKPADEQLATADAGITGAFAGVASSGSVCVALGPELVAAASLLMPLHIVLLPVERIVARPRDLFDPERFEGESLRRNLVFITGPSATADMGPLVRGVHGPHRLHVLLLE
jgi:L-lactate dehydrogenase complex protein LldG